MGQWVSKSEGVKVKSYQATKLATGARAGPALIVMVRTAHTIAAKKEAIWLLFDRVMCVSFVCFSK